MVAASGVVFMVVLGDVVVEMWGVSCGGLF